MVDSKLTECISLIDKSGSMSTLVGDVIGGYNKLLKDQKAMPDKANFTMIQFDTGIQTLYENMPILKVPEMEEKDYNPGGCTALLDAVGDTITSIGQRLAATPEDKRPGKVILAIMTDGQENSSTRYKKAQIKEMVETQQKTYKWEIMFIGAGIDAFVEAGGIGISRAQTMVVTHDTKGMGETFENMSRSYSMTRSK